MEFMATVDENYRCGYCYNEIKELVDPRILPCSHVFCFQCLTEDVKVSPIFKCVICRKEHKNLIIKNLPPYTLTVKSRKPCDICKTPDSKEAEYHCAQCNKDLCADHTKIHEEMFRTFGQVHEVLPTNSVCTIPPVLERGFCELHPNEEPRLACSKCLKAICDECIIDSECPAAPDKKHTFDKLFKMSNSLKRSLEIVVSEMHKSSLFVDELDKEACKMLEEQRARCDDMKSQIEKVTSDQIQEIMQKSEMLKDQIEEFYKESQRHIEDYCFTIMSIKDNLDQASGQLLSLIHQALDVEVINEYTPLLVKSQRLLEWKLEALSLPALELEPRGQSREVEIGLRSTENIIAISAKDVTDYGKPIVVTISVDEQEMPAYPTGDQTRKSQQIISNNSRTSSRESDPASSSEDPREELSSLIAHLLFLRMLLEQRGVSGSAHVGVSCDSCNKNIHGERYKCCACPNYDLCDECFGYPREIIHHEKHVFMKLKRPMSDNKVEELLTNFKKDAVDYGNKMDLSTDLHLAKHKCGNCKKSPIKGTRFRCLVCNGFDFCSSCEADAEAHDRGHPLLALEHPPAI